jgi:hypothetical protein
MTWVGACLVAVFIIGTIVGNVFSRQREDTERDQSHAEKLDYPSDADEEASIAAVARAQIAAAKDSYATAKDNAAHNERSRRISFWTPIGVGIYTVFTAVIVIFSIVQYGETHRFNKNQVRLMSSQFEVAQKTLVMSERPWPYIDGNITFSHGDPMPNETRGSFTNDVINEGNSIAVSVEMGGRIQTRAFFADTNYKDLPYPVKTG